MIGGNLWYYGIVLQFDLIFLLTITMQRKDLTGLLKKRNSKNSRFVNNNKRNL